MATIQDSAWQVAAIADRDPRLTAIMTGAGALPGVFPLLTWNLANFAKYPSEPDGVI